MGCCASTTGKNGDSSPQIPNSDDRSTEPPPPPPEETVKEVLSETPNPKPKLIEQEQELKKNNNNIPNPKPLPIVKLTDEDKIKIHKTPPFYHEEEEEEEISVGEEEEESESVSATTTLTRDEDDEVTGARVYRHSSPLKNYHRSFSGDLGRGVVRSNQSPGRRNGTGFGSGRVRDSHNSQWRGPPPPPLPHYRRREYSGEVSAPRRSRSPATTRSNVGRSQSAGRACRSPGRVKSSLVDPRTIRRTNNANNNNTDESLDNPLVSLECFIFL
ncbi:uncharacterized protein LOC115698074 [Cannabis sativa]|uniref:uncharacterized protein LOC115698074 n=1 Tax=Cannabis sativa TaxID=3483 RepID=UPI0011DF23F6|nr:uncharacterized protein LOC115698074 [Cannabis sativa]